MRKQLLILSAVISFSVIACTDNPAGTTDSGSGSNAGGGSVNPVDSLKKPGTGINGGSSNNLGLGDTTTPGHSSASPFTDTAKRKKP
jgi:hypothetical protein